MTRYDRELSLEIDRTVNRFNAKIKRLERLDRNLELPDPIERSDIVTYKRSKSSIQKRLKEYQKFLERGAEEMVETSGGAKISRYEMNQLKARQRTAKATLTKKINKMKNTTIKVASEKQAGTFATMGDPEYITALSNREALDKDLNKLNKESLARFKRFVGKLVYSGDKDYILKENYLEILEKTAYSFGIDKRHYDVIKKKLNSLSPSQFANLFSEDKAIQSLMDYYHQMKSIKTDNQFKNLQNDVEDLYDLLVNNIDEIIEDYE